MPQLSPRSQESVGSMVVVNSVPSSNGVECVSQEISDPTSPVPTDLIPCGFHELSISKGATTAVDSSTNHSTVTSNPDMLHCEIPELYLPSSVGSVQVKMMVFSIHGSLV